MTRKVARAEHLQKALDADDAEVQPSPRAVHHHAEQRDPDEHRDADDVERQRDTRERLRREIGKRGGPVFFPELEFCSDNGAMIAFACAMRLEAGKVAGASGGAFAVRPRWPLAEIS